MHIKNGSKELIWKIHCSTPFHCLLIAISNNFEDAKEMWVESNMIIWRRHICYGCYRYSKNVEHLLR
jgi:hypothetical protein